MNRHRVDQVKTLKGEDGAAVERATRERRLQAVDLELSDAFPARLKLERQVGDAEVQVEEFRALVDVLLSVERSKEVVVVIAEGVHRVFSVWRR